MKFGSFIAATTATFAIGISACSQMPATKLTEQTLDFDHLGPLTLGMTLAEIKKAARQDFELVFYDLEFMIRQKRDAPPEKSECEYAIPAIESLGIGLIERDIFKVFDGRVIKKPHAYVDDGFYLIIEKGDGTALVFETEEDKVTTYRSGKIPDVEAIEGCL